MANLTRIAPEIPVSDVPEALDYYERRLGFETKTVMPGGEYAIVERDGIALHLFSDGGNTARAAFHLFTDDLDGLRDELRSRGAAIAQDIERKPWGTRDFRVTDPSGNELKFSEP